MSDEQGVVEPDQPDSPRGKSYIHTIPEALEREGWRVAMDPDGGFTAHKDGRMIGIVFNQADIHTLVYETKKGNGLFLDTYDPDEIIKGIEKLIKEV